MRRVLGITDKNKFAHHIIPWDLGVHPAIQKAAKGSNAFHLNEAFNGIPLSRTVHNSGHPNYIIRVRQALDAIPANLGPFTTRTEVDKVINRIKAAIAANPNTNIDNLIF